MKYYSTNKKSSPVDVRSAVLQGLADDGGLFMPDFIPKYPRGFVDSLKTMSFAELAYVVAQLYLDADVPNAVLQDLVEDAFDFSVPSVEVAKDRFVLELFHGPTLAFKDFGARFMARLMAYFLRNADREVYVLVATSGDTGSAVAHGFYGVEGVKVVLLYPEGKVSELQEKQFATLGGNVTSYRVRGVFDDCQAMVKKAFMDTELKQSHQLASANSINIARLIPQSFYYAASYGAVAEGGEKLTFCIPSGNFGNLTAGIFAKEMGLPVERFIAATNSNSVVPEYLQTGEFKPRASVSTISNAMDVGNPSNFARLSAIFGGQVERMREVVSGVAVSEADTRETISRVFGDYGYSLCPHTAVGWHAASDVKGKLVVLGTAHPAKFKDTVEAAIEQEVELPPSLADCASKEVLSAELSNSYDDFKEQLITL